MPTGGLVAMETTPTGVVAMGGSSDSVEYLWTGMEREGKCGGCREGGSIRFSSESAWRVE